MDLSLLIINIIISFSASLLGVFVVLRRLALVSDVLSHVALPGIAIALMFEIDPFIGAFAALFLAILGIFFIEQKFSFSIETLVGIVFTMALAIGMLIIPSEELIESLFGNIAEVNIYDLFFIAPIGFLLIVIILINFKKFAGVTFSRELAKGGNRTQTSVRKTEFLFLFSLALAIAIGIKVAGTLLMGALLILPASAAKNIARNLKTMTILSVLFGFMQFALGITIANVFNVPSGAIIILVGGVIFLISLIASAMRK